MKQEERASAIAGVLLVQPVYELRTESCQRLILAWLSWRIRQIGQQCEVEVPIVISEGANLQVIVRKNESTR